MVDQISSPSRSPSAAPAINAASALRTVRIGSRLQLRGFLFLASAHHAAKPRRPVDDIAAVVISHCLIGTSPSLEYECDTA